MNDLKETITLIVACKNADKVLPKLINSYKNQTYSKKELIIIDGKSTDNTKNILLRNKKFITKWISETDKGICDAWNKGIKLSRGEWILFFGADDKFYEKNTLEKVALELIKLDKKQYVAYAKILTVTSDDKILAEYGEPWYKNKEKFRSIMSIPHQGVFHRKITFKKFGFFDSNFKYAGDYDLLVKVFKENEPFFLKNSIISKMAIGGQSSLPSESWQVLIDFFVVRKKNNIQAFTIFWIFIFLKSIIKYFMSQILGDFLTLKIIKRLKS